MKLYCKAMEFPVKASEVIILQPCKLNSFKMMILSIRVSADIMMSIVLI